jgi:Ser/Thr protein kinase RdoA (MazF antagonist)
MSHTKTPYDNLEPHLIINAIEDLGFKCTGSLLALNSYENRVYQIGIEDASPLIAKFYRPHRWIDAAILEEHQFELELAEHEIPVVAPWMSDAKKNIASISRISFRIISSLGWPCT